MMRTNAALTIARITARRTRDRSLRDALNRYATLTAIARAALSAQRDNNTDASAAVLRLLVDAGVRLDANARSVFAAITAELDRLARAIETRTAELQRREQTQSTGGFVDPPDTAGHTLSAPNRDRSQHSDRRKTR